jgi:hypothetical protein
MASWKRYWPWLFLASITGFLWCGIPAERSGTGRSGPREIKEILVIAQQLGLHCRGDRPDGTVGRRLLISETLLTWERANALFIGLRVTADWSGTVAVFPGQREVYSVPLQMTAWGQFLLYGDPTLIQKLIGSTDS